MIKKDLIYSNQQTMFGAKEIIGFGSDSFHVKEIDRNRANDIIIKNHYSELLNSSFEYILFHVFM